MNLTDLAADHPDRAAVVMAETGQTLTFAELEAASNRIAHLFVSLGLTTGDHIAILMRNQIEVFTTSWAAQRTGLLYTPVNWHLSDDEAAYVIDNCQAKVLILDESFAELARATAESTPRVERRYVVGAAEGMESLDDATAAFPSIPVDDQLEGYPMFYSSGTTGRPKGILPATYGEPFGTGKPIDHRMKNVFGFGPTSVYLSPGPLYHAAPLAWSLGTIRNGGTVVVMAAFDAELALRSIERYRVTHGQFVPTMFVRMLKLDPALRGSIDVSSLECVIHGAAPCPIEVKEQMIDWFGPIVVEFYGGTEANGFFTIRSQEWLEHKGSVGQALVGEPHIVGPDGTELPPGEVGEIWIGGLKPFEYHDDPAKTASVFNDRGWSTLGDLGHLDEDGYLFLSARRTDLILSGGVNIYPQEIEDALVLHPKVEDVAVIGLADAEMGQRVHAVVKLADPADASDDVAEELKDFARARIARFKVPRTVSFDDVPRLPSGKILKRELMARYDAVDAS